MVLSKMGFVYVILDIMERYCETKNDPDICSHTGPDCNLQTGICKAKPEFGGGEMSLGCLPSGFSFIDACNSQGKGTPKYDPTCGGVCTADSTPPVGNVQDAWSCSGGSADLQDYCQKMKAPDYQNPRFGGNYVRQPHDCSWSGTCCVTKGDDSLSATCYKGATDVTGSDGPGCCWSTEEGEKSIWIPGSRLGMLLFSHEVE